MKAINAYHDLIAFFVSCGIAGGFLALNELANKKGWVSANSSRKLVHTGQGLIFIMCWGLFSNNFEARYYAASIVFILTIYIGLVGLGVIIDRKLIASLSRTGDRRELLIGPLCYGAAITYSTAVYWKHSAAGVASIIILCAGDGMAGLVGSLYGRDRLFWNRQKSFQGLMAFAMSSFIVSELYIMVFLLNRWMVFDPAWWSVVLGLVVFLCALVESLPWGAWDNAAVYLIALISLRYFGF